MEDSLNSQGIPLIPPAYNRDSRDSAETDAEPRSDLVSCPSQQAALAPFALLPTTSSSTPSALLVVVAHLEKENTDPMDCI